MLRKLICLILIGLLCLPACAEQKAPSHLYHFTSAAEAPAKIADSIADLFGSDVTYIDGYATMRFGRWTSGQIILQDAQEYIFIIPIENLKNHAQNHQGTQNHIPKERTLVFP